MRCSQIEPKRPPGRERALAVRRQRRDTLFIFSGKDQIIGLLDLNRLCKLQEASADLLAQLLDTVRGAPFRQLQIFLPGQLRLDIQPHVDIAIAQEIIGLRELRVLDGRDLKCL